MQAHSGTCQLRIVTLFLVYTVVHWFIVWESCLRKRDKTQQQNKKSCSELVWVTLWETGTDFLICLVTVNDNLFGFVFRTPWCQQSSYCPQQIRTTTTSMTLTSVAMNSLSLVMVAVCEALSIHTKSKHIQTLYFLNCWRSTYHKALVS